MSLFSQKNPFSLHVHQGFQLSTNRGQMRTDRLVKINVNRAQALFCTVKVKQTRTREKSHVRNPLCSGMPLFVRCSLTAAKITCLHDEIHTDGSKFII